MVSIRWYLGSIRGWLSGPGAVNLQLPDCRACGTQACARLEMSCWSFLDCEMVDRMYSGVRS